MAYGLKYEHNFHQIKDYGTGTEWSIQIHQEGYVGSVSEIEKIDAGSINLNREGELLEVIQGTKLTFSIVNQTEGQYKEFRTADWGDYKVILIKDPDGTPLTKFIGYNQSEIYTESYDQPPYSSVLEFTCGLNHLKHIKWDEADNKLEEDSKDANSILTFSAPLSLGDSAGAVSFTVNATSGSHSNHVVTLQKSPDGVNWSSTDFRISGAGATILSSDLVAPFARLWVSTAEGSASVIDWSLTPVYSGQKSMIEVIRLALNKLPSPLNIREFVNVYEDSINSTDSDSMLNQIFVDSSVYKKKSEEGSKSLDEAFNCNETLEENLKVFGVNLFQANGIWYIVRVQEYIENSMIFRDFNANVGTESTISISGSGTIIGNDETITGPSGLDDELILVAPDSELSINPPLNRVQITYNQTNIEQESSDWIKNGCMNDFTGSGIPFIVALHWNFTGSDPSTYESWYYNSNGNGYQIYMLDFDPATQGEASVFDSGIYIEQVKSALPTSTVDSLLFSFKTYFSTGFSGNGSPTPVINWINDSLEVVYEIEIKLGTFYLHGNEIDGYSWVESTGRAIFKTAGGYAQNSGSTATTFNYSTHWWREFNLALPKLPETAFVDYRIRVFQPYCNSKPFADAGDFTFTPNRMSQSCFSLIYMPLEAAPTEELVINSTIIEDENIEEIEVLHADGTNSGTLNSFRTSNGLITNEWTRRDEADDTDILTLFLRQLAEMRGDFVKEVSGSLIGEIDIFNTINHTTDVFTHYYIKTYNWSIETSEYDVTLSQLQNLPLSQLPDEIAEIGLLVNADPSEDTEQHQISFIPSFISNGSIVSPSIKIKPNQADLNNFI